MTTAHTLRRFLFNGALIAAAGVCMLGGKQALAACANPTGAAGDMIYNTDHNTAQFCNDTVWVRMGGGSGGGSASAAGSTNQIQFNGGSSAFAADSNLNWDNSAKSLLLGTVDANAATAGVGISSSTGLMDINGTDSRIQFVDTTAQTAWWFGTPAWVSGKLVLYNNALSGSEKYLLSFSTTGNTGMGVATANASALLDMTSTTKGFLPPRMTTTQRDAISGPAEGLVVYNTTTKSLDLRLASSWLTFGGSQSGSTLVSGFPDVIQCIYSGTSMFLHLDTRSATITGYASAKINGGAASVLRILYTNAGAYSSSAAVNADSAQLIGSSDCVTNAWSISDLYTQGRAFNLAGGGGGSASAVGAAGTIQFAGASNVFAGDATNFFWDDTNNRLGIGTATPSNSLDIQTSTQYGGIFVGNGTNVTAKLIGLSASNDNGYFQLLSGGTANVQLTAGTGIYNYINSSNLGIGTTTPAATALLDVSSTTKGFLPPRMTTTQRDAIASPATALIIFNSTTGQLEFWNGTQWTGVGSMTAGTIAAFAATSCPSGWTEYTAARGRFLRGIDPSGSTAVDPRGTVAPGTQQADEFKSHLHGPGSGTALIVYGAGDANLTVANGAGWTIGGPSGTNTGSTGGNETRPKNVAVIYCQYSGSGGGGGGSTLTDGDKGDITVSSSGSAWAVDPGAISYAKLQNVSATNRLLGRATAGAGVVEEITIGSGLTLTGTTLSASGTGSSGTAGYVQFSGGSGAFADSGTTAGEQLFWDNTNKRLGIGTASPATKLDVNGLVHGMGFSTSGTLPSDIWNPQEVMGFGASAPSSVTQGIIGHQGSHELDLFWNFYRNTGSTYTGLAANSYTSANGIRLGNAGILFVGMATMGTTIPPTLMTLDNNGLLGLGVAPQTGSLLNVGTVGYAQFQKTFAGAPTAGDCDAAAEAGRVTYDTTNNRWYVCEGTGGWVISGDGTGLASEADTLATITARGTTTNVNLPASTTIAAKTGGGGAGIEVVAQGSAGTAGAAVIAFHRPSSHAMYFGLDTDNFLKIGGWSLGANAYKVWTQNTDGAGSGLDADLLDGQSGAYYLDADNLGNHTATTTLALGANALTSASGTVIDANGGWHRSYGNTGWYNGTHGGGWYMTDTTYIRNYNTKEVLLSNNITAVAFLYSSDSRLKENVKPLESALEKLSSINGLTFTYKTDNTHREHLGVMAQDVEKVYPQAVITDEKGFKKVDYPALVPALIEAVKDLKAQNATLRARLDKLEAKEN